MEIFAPVQMTIKTSNVLTQLLLFVCVHETKQRRRPDNKWLILPHTCVNNRIQQR